jgi:hypothetical protein
VRPEKAAFPFGNRIGRRFHRDSVVGGLAGVLDHRAGRAEGPCPVMSPSEPRRVRGEFARSGFRDLKLPHGGVEFNAKQLQKQVFCNNGMPTRHLGTRRRAVAHPPFRRCAKSHSATPASR